MGINPALLTILAPKKAIQNALYYFLRLDRIVCKKCFQRFWWFKNLWQLNFSIITTGIPGELRKSGNLIFDQKTREFQHFIQNSGKVREFEYFNTESNFHANFKTKLLNIQSYIGTLNGLFLIFFVTKSQILVNITCN